MTETTTAVIAPTAPTAPEAIVAAPAAPAAPVTTPEPATPTKELSAEDRKLAADLLNQDWTADLPVLYFN